MERPTEEMGKIEGDRKVTFVLSSLGAGGDGAIPFTTEEENPPGLL